MITRRRFLQGVGVVATAALVPINRLHAPSELVQLPAAYHQNMVAPWIRHDSNWDEQAYVIDEARESFRQLDQHYVELPAYSQALVDVLPLEIKELRVFGPNGEGIGAGWVEFYVRRPGYEVPGRMLRELPNWGKS